MTNAIKVFVQAPVITGYVEASHDPLILQFQFNAGIQYFGVLNDVIFTDAENWQYNAVIGDSPGLIYAALYANIIEKCTVMGWPLPGQKDIFAFIPTALSQIFIDVPSLA